MDIYEPDNALRISVRARRLYKSHIKCAEMCNVSKETWYYWIQRWRAGYAVHMKPSQRLGFLRLHQKSSRELGLAVEGKNEFQKIAFKVARAKPKTIHMVPFFLHISRERWNKLIEGSAWPTKAEHDRLKKFWRWYSPGLTKLYTMD